jgi:Tfp pilus assembly protein PilP
MKLAKSSATVWAVLALSFTLSSAAGAQSAPAKNAARKAKASSSKNPAPAASSEAKTSKASTNDPAPAMKSDAVTAKRDPFQPLVSNTKPSHGPLPPGKAGLIIGTVHVDGTVKSPSGMMAVVSNEEQKVYFIREGDKLYDGDVEKIGLDGVTFKENSKDAFGKPVERMVTKRIYQSAGEQQ